MARRPTKTFKRRAAAAKPAPATAAALRLPEIRAAIFEQLDGRNRKPLLAAAHVSRAWAADALRVLWRCVTDAALAARPSYGGFNYAAWIRSLTITSTLPSAKILLDWPPALPQLQSLSLDGTAIRQEARDILSGAMGI